MSGPRRSPRRHRSCLPPDPERHGGDSKVGTYLYELPRAEETINVEELRTEILSYLSPADLRSMRRVDHTWNNTIRNPIPIMRRAMFLQVDGGPPAALAPGSGPQDEPPIRRRHFNDALLRPGARTTKFERGTGGKDILHLIHDPLITPRDRTHLDSFITQLPTIWSYLNVYMTWRWNATEKRPPRESKKIAMGASLVQSGVTYADLIKELNRQIENLQEDPPPDSIEIDLEQSFVRVHYTRLIDWRK